MAMYFIPTIKNDNAGVNVFDIQVCAILNFKFLYEKVKVKIKLVCLHYRWYTHFPTKRNTPILRIFYPGMCTVLQKLFL